jgi:hypothetical protein
MIFKKTSLGVPRRRLKLQNRKPSAEAADETGSDDLEVIQVSIL